jgi:homoserine O-succinyltransferase
MIRLADPALAVRPAAPLALRPRLTLGLLNNMPDAALCATERQFGELLKAASGETGVDLRLFALPGLERGERARAAMAGRYESAEALADAGLDGLIVTGNEPRAAELDAEPYWPALARVIDWTQSAAVPTLWSCLAAHAAVLRLSGVRRRPLPAKLSGVFENDIVADDPLVAGATQPVMTPHSRQNGLAEDDLVRRGYRILTLSPEAGVDAFAGPGASLFLQGHPEYDADSLMREYLRDVGRFLRRERAAHPGTPAGYFGPAIERRLAELAAGSRTRPDPARLPLYADALTGARPTHSWRPSAVRLYRNWLSSVADAAQAPRWRVRGVTRRAV